MHGRIPDAENYLNGNKLRAIQMHKYLFNASFRYYQLFYNEKATRPTYIHPKDMAKKELSIETCAICGRKTSKDSIFCSQCNWEMEQYHNLKTLINDRGYEGSFKRDDLIRLGFDKGTANQLLRELQDQNLIRAISRIYRFNKDNITEYHEKMNSYFRIEEMVYAYSNGRISLAEIRESEEYTMGKNGEEPFVEFYGIISNDSASQFLEQYGHRDIKTIIDSGILTPEEFQHHLNNTEAFSDVREDIKTEFLKLKKLRKSRDTIKSQLFIDDCMYDELDNDKKIQNSVEENRKQQYLNNINSGRSYDHAMKVNHLTWEDVNGYLDKDPDFRRKYNAVVEKRKEKFLVLTEKYNVKKAFKESRLTEEQLREAFVKKAYDDFYLRLNQILRKKYLHCRRKGMSAQEAAEESHIPLELVENWKNNREFADSINMIRYEILLKELKKNGSLESALKISNIKEKEFTNTLIEAYRQEEESQILEFYTQNILPDQFNRFLKSLSKNNEKKALKNTLLNQKLLKHALSRNEEYRARYIDVKIFKFIEYSTKSRTSKALKMAELSKTEYEANKEFINAERRRYKRRKILNEVKYNNKSLKQAAKMVKLTLDDVYGEYSKGQYSVGEARDFADQLDLVYIGPAAEFMKSEKRSDRELMAFLKRHNDDIPYWNRLHITNKFPAIDIALCDAPDAMAC
ncbi:MAG: hypothetical protein Q4P18_07955 [Methanobrevibacter sp.]|uniref:hypothetical protein n=1 Tax=Methanobrevibacter sp. TaxID=66852 RepID=UPI0026E0AEDA|nr:hypothetical protein [Methanobrevibacter sp.]MDO5849454.1 hypothetical protein [Methanobrevibacter sp.]